MKQLVLAFLVVGILAADDGPGRDAVKKEKEKLQGLWGVTGDGRGGVFNPAKGVPVVEITPQRIAFFLIVKRDKEIVKKEGTEVQGTYTLDPGADPRTIDITWKTGPDKGKTWRGLYALDGDDLKLAFSLPPGKKRPASFPSEDEKGVEILVLERAKPGKK